VDYSLVRKFVYNEESERRDNPELAGPGLETIEQNDQVVERDYETRKTGDSNEPKVYKLYLVTYKIRFAAAWSLNMIHIYHSGIFVVPIEDNPQQIEEKNEKYKEVLNKKDPSRHILNELSEGRVLQYGYKSGESGEAQGTGVFTGGDRAVYFEPQTVFLGYTNHPECHHLCATRSVAPLIASQRRLAAIQNLTSGFRRGENKWSGNTYHGYINNCNHFSVEMILALRPNIARDLLAKLTDDDKRYLAFGDINLDSLGEVNPEHPYDAFQPPIDEIKKILYELTEQAQTMISKEHLIKYQVHFGNKVKKWEGKSKSHLINCIGNWRSSENLKSLGQLGYNCHSIAKDYLDIDEKYIKRLINFHTIDI